MSLEKLKKVEAKLESELVEFLWNFGKENKVGVLSIGSVRPFREDGGSVMEECQIIDLASDEFLITATIPAAKKRKKKK